ncbi:MAG: serine/threonine-protein kinase, partial [Isosphaeraceae bacterium]
HEVTLRVEAEVLGEVPPPQPQTANGKTDSLPLLPLEIPGYRIIETLRDGAMGRVYRARQTSVDRPVAIKVLHEKFAGQPEYAERLRLEAQMTARLSHGHIVQVIDAGEVNGHHFLVTEFVEGETVQDRLDRHEVFDEPEAITIALDVAEALAHIQERGLVHRDIKPANVILNARGGVKLIDLGLARPIDDPDWAVAEAGMAVGTPEYISPEQVRGQVDLDIRSDIYSLGASLYHMITGVVPYPGKTTAEVMQKHVDRDVALVPPEEINPRVSQALGSIVGTMLAKNREDRYRDPVELILELNRLRSGGSSALVEQGSFRGPSEFRAREILE